MPIAIRSWQHAVVARSALAVALVHVLPGTASAHPGLIIEPHDLATAWTFDAWVVSLVFVPAVLYGVGTARVWMSAGFGRGVRYTHVVAFASATLIMSLALISPLDALGSALFSAHMTQHQLLMVVAPPLYLLGAPAIAFSWSFPSSYRQTYAGVVRSMAKTGLWRTLSHPGVAWSLHATAIWLWHIPSLYERTLVSDSLHAAQHFCFSASAMLFWWTVIHPSGSGVRGRGTAMLSLFTTAVHTSALAALLTFASTPWYLVYAGSTRAWGLTLLEDQQLGGLIMWVPGGIAYTAAALLAAMIWLRQIEQRTGIRVPATPIIAPRV